MGRRLRYTPEGSLVEVTCRTIQGRFLLKPFPGWRETFVGALARAQSRYPLQVHAFVCLSNHFHLLVTPRDARELAGFMRYLLSKLSIEAGRRHRWRGPLFERRYQAILVSHEEGAQVLRLRYLLAHGVKEHLVAKVADWPGPHCGTALAESTHLTGIWRDRTREWSSRNRGEDLPSQAFHEPCELALAPLPCWRGLRATTRARYVREMIAELEAAIATERRARGVPYMGARAILDQDPHHGPKYPKRSSAPHCHAFTKGVRRQLHRAYALFAAAYRQAAHRLAEGDRSVGFPEGSFPPAIPFQWAIARAPSPG